MKRIFFTIAVLLLATAFATTCFAQNTPASSGLPTGFILTSTGIVCVGTGQVCNPTGTVPASDVGTWTFNVTACDSEVPPVCSPSTQISLTISASGNCTVAVSPTILNPGLAGKPYSQKMAANGSVSCVPPYAFTN